MLLNHFQWRTASQQRIFSPKMSIGLRFRNDGINQVEALSQKPISAWKSNFAEINALEVPDLTAKSGQGSLLTSPVSLILNWIRRWEIHCSWLQGITTFLQTHLFCEPPHAKGQPDSTQLYWSELPFISNPLCLCFHQSHQGILKFIHFKPCIIIWLPKRKSLEWDLLMPPTGCVTLGR